MAPSEARRYVATEALIGAVISAVISVLFVMLLFQGTARAPVAGLSGLIADGVPQGFATALMATLVPTLITRRRLAAGRIMSTGTRERKQLAFFAVAAGLLGAALTAGLTGLLLVFDVRDVAFPLVLLVKPIWGFLLGGAIAANATRAALAGR